MVQNLYLVRHGIAEDREIFKTTGLSDHLRPLTPLGQKKMMKISKWLSVMIPESLDFVIESPLLRSKQTLDILLEDLTAKCRLEFSLLDPSQAPELLVEKILTMKGSQILCVGHEPHLSELLALFLGFDPNLQSPFKFKKGGVACLSFKSYEDSLKVTLEWLVAPKAILSKGLI